MTVTALRFDQACLAAGDLTTCATTQKDPGAGVGGAPVSYAGDATITTTCAGITWRATCRPAGHRRTSSCSPRPPRWSSLPLTQTSAPSRSTTRWSTTAATSTRTRSFRSPVSIRRAAPPATQSATTLRRAARRVQGPTPRARSAPLPTNATRLRVTPTLARACRRPSPPARPAPTPTVTTAAPPAAKPSKGSASACKRTW